MGLIHSRAAKARNRAEAALADEQRKGLRTERREASRRDRVTVGTLLAKLLDRKDGTDAQA
jgi:hypothetical protein